MNALHRIYTIIGAWILFHAYTVYGLVNIFRPYDMMLRPYVDYETETVQAYVTLEGGIGAASAWDSEGKVASPLSIWFQVQRCLQMLEGFSPSAAPTQLLTKIDANNAGTRGDMCINAPLYLDVAGAGVMRYFFLEQCAVSVYLPFYRYRLADLCLVDLTPNENPPSPQDFRVKEFLTGDIQQAVLDVGCFELCEWERTGLGDITFFIDWQRVFPQAKQFLKSVMVALRIGLTAPSGKQADPDLVFAFPFGYNGMWSIPFGFTLETLFGYHWYVGFDVELTQIFGNAVSQRIHTAHGQTDLMFMEKARVYYDPGLEQQYSVYVGMRDLPEGLNIRAVYQYRKHNHDVISPFGNCVNSAIANEAVSLQDSTLHTAIVRVDYDFSVLMDEPCVSPQLELFARIPFNGKRSVGNTTIGFAITIDF